MIRAAYVGTYPPRTANIAARKLLGEAGLGANYPGAALRLPNTAHPFTFLRLASGLATTGCEASAPILVIGDRRYAALTCGAPSLRRSGSIKLTTFDGSRSRGAAPVGLGEC